MTEVRPSPQRKNMRLTGSRLTIAKLTFVLAVMGLAWVNVCFGQLCATTHATDLYCLLPYAFHTQAAPFNAIFTPFGTELSELPTARATGKGLIGAHGGLAPDSRILGAIFTELPETLGKRRFYVGATYQSFTFGVIDGTSLKHIPIVLYYPPLQVYTESSDRVDVRVGQYTIVAAAGLTERTDVSVTIPFERVSMAASVRGTEYGPGGATASVSERVPGAADGLSDVVFGLKRLLVDGTKMQLAAGLDYRIPSGDELNFLGSGTQGLRPYLALMSEHKLSPHLNVGYQWNGASILNPSSAGGKQTLPTDFFFNGGVSYKVNPRWMLTADVLGRTFFHEPRLSAPMAIAIPGVGNAMSVQPYFGGLTTADLSMGFKARMISHLAVTGDVTVKLNSGGLHATAVPLGGLSYSF
jgi:hypothetical protein